MIRNGFHKFLGFLARLEAEHIPYTLSHCRTDAIMVTVSLPGERWEIEIFANGAVEVEKFISDGTIYGEDFLRTFFNTYGKQETGVLHRDDSIATPSEEYAQQALR